MRNTCGGVDWKSQTVGRARVGWVDVSVRYQWRPRKWLKHGTFDWSTEHTLEMVCSVCAWWMDAYVNIRDDVVRLTHDGTVIPHGHPETILVRVLRVTFPRDENSPSAPSSVQHPYSDRCVDWLTNWFGWNRAGRGAANRAIALCSLWNRKHRGGICMILSHAGGKEWIFVHPLFVW